MLVSLTSCKREVFFCFVLILFSLWQGSRSKFVPHLSGNTSEELVSALRCSSQWQGLGLAGPFGPVDPVGGHGSVEAVYTTEVHSSCLSLGEGLGRDSGGLSFYCKKEKEMNLSSCIADSVVLSFDSAGQTLGSGTTPSPSIILSALDSGHIWSRA